jgi:hypothetical protein
VWECVAIYRLKPALRREGRRNNERRKSVTKEERRKEKVKVVGVTKRG